MKTLTSVPTAGPLRRWRLLSPWAQDGLLGMVFTVAAVVPGLRSGGVVLANLPPRPLDALAVLLVLGQGLPLALRRRAPMMCLTLLSVAFAVYQARGYTSLFTGLGLFVALYSASAHQARHRRLLIVAAVAAYVALAATLHALGSLAPPADYAAFFLALGGSWALGAWVRARAQEETGRRERERQATVLAERARIARELHDVVTHHVTAMVVQADAATYLTASPERVTAALDDIAATGRRALVELRHQLGVLDAAAGQPEPVSSRVPAVGGVHDLVEHAAASGQSVRLIEHGRAGSLSDGVALAVYRVVQESLTNALKHAPSQPVTIALRYEDATVGVEVTSAAPATGALPGPDRLPTGPGRGLTGLRERVLALDGHLQTGPGPDGSFRVCASIPTAAS
ncbi:sensor histidine kinase [Kineococcus rubinsiae]|uniref:sensor histidine kinase n=1 Tax=Kineococcus rubinsiae TaxID=2609562 RepID=UPI001430FAE1|nr:histidine kinase [Kineococcus rubinsiae]NIZ90365.1 two-component sensor histidine kinase [Kineococcus rubinsiae]